MMLTTKGRYAVMSTTEIALFSKPITIASISLKQNIPANYLEQILNKLRKTKIVKAIKGPKGGYILSRPASEVTVEEIVNAVEENIEMTRCNKSEGGCLEKGARCLTHQLWEGLESHIRNYLRSITIQDLISKGMKEDNKILKELSL